MDPTNAYQQMMMANALMGTQAMPGTMPSGQMPQTPWGQRAMSGQPTAPGGMLGTSPWTPFDPNSPQGPLPPTMDPMSGGPGNGPGGMNAPLNSIDQQALSARNALYAADGLNPQQPNPFQLSQSYQSYPGMEGQQHADSGGSDR